MPLDLFGQPLLDPEGPGRPPHKPTAAIRRKVRRMRAQGRKQIDIAQAVGLTVPTLTRHYGTELKSKARRVPLIKKGRT